jgi:hypothetical protein
MEARERIEELEKENDEMHKAFQVSARRRIELEGALREAIELIDYCGKIYVDYEPEQLERLRSVLPPNTNTEGSHD